MNPLLIFLLIAGTSTAALGGYVAYERYQDSKQTEIASLGNLNQPVDPADPVNKAKPAPSGEANKEPSKQEGADAETAATKPTFDIVRVEKDGNVLVAGQTVANAAVSLLNNGKRVGSATADDTGAFVILPDQPLKGGNNELSVESKSADGAVLISDQRVAVAIPEEGEALVALVEPGKPVAILQNPTQKEAPTPDASSVTEEKPETDQTIAAVEEGKQDPESTEVLVSEDRTKIAETKDTPKGDTQTIAADPQSPPSVSKKDKSKRVARLVVEPESPTAEPKPTAEVAVEAEQETQTVENEPAETPVNNSTDEPEQAKATVSVEAVEVENDTLFIAGKSEPNQTVRIYVDGGFVSDVRSNEKGAWLLEAKKPLGPGNYKIGVDLLQSGSGQVSARAEVPFVVEDLTAQEQAAVSGGSVIIRENDNLWTIAQRLYGDGQRYTAIYQQNRDQIRNPGLIFPGQIFKLPENAPGVDAAQNAEPADADGSSDGVTTE